MAIPLVAAAAIPAVTNIIGGALADSAASGDRQRAQEAADQAMRYLARIGMPPAEAKDIVYQSYQRVGIYQPDFEQAVEDLHSRFEDIKADEKSKNIQLEAIKQIRDRSRRGMTVEEEAAQAKGLRNIATQEQARRESILQNLQARGMGGSGAEIQALLQESQGGANKEADLALGLAAQRSQNAQASTKALIDAASSFRKQGYEEEALKAAKEDELNKFNRQNQINRQARNVEAANIGKRLNLGEEQRIADINAQMANKEIERKATAPLRDWRNQADWLKGQAGASMAESDIYSQRGQEAADRTGKQVGAIGSGLTGIINAYNQQSAADATKKKEAPEMLQAGGSTISTRLFR